MQRDLKKSFILYFDSAPCLEELSMEQRGLLFTALMDYAQEVLEGTPPEAFLERYTALQPPGRVAFRFMAESIRRDTEKWLQKHNNYQEAAARRAAEKQDDSAYLRRLIRQRESAL